MVKALTTALLISAAIVLAASAARGETALEQLQKGTSGNKTTGQTFDGGKTLTDTSPKGDVRIETPVGRPIDTSSGTVKSTGTASGFDVSPSSGTAKTPRKGTETAK